MDLASPWTVAAVLPRRAIQPGARSRSCLALDLQIGRQQNPVSARPTTSAAIANPSWHRRPLSFVSPLYHSAIAAAAREATITRVKSGYGSRLSLCWKAS